MLSQAKMENKYWVDLSNSNVVYTKWFNVVESLSMSDIKVPKLIRVKSVCFI